jgi:protein-serine/threonine kinase
VSRSGQDDGLLTTNTLSTFGLVTPTKNRDDYSGEEGRKKSVPVLEDFELIRVVGKGCAGRVSSHQPDVSDKADQQVMMVRHTETAKIQAMKAISKRSVLTYDELDHTLTEVRILKQFAKYEPNNPFIVRLNYAFMDKENIYFVMDFYPGTLTILWRADGRWRFSYSDGNWTIGSYEDTVLRSRYYSRPNRSVRQPWKNGLIISHRHGIIVRDIKPENILLKSDGHAVLADFGLSKQFSYRGQPAAVTIPIYPGQPPLPYWAGAGLGSVRPNYNGRHRVMIDRAESFVGTAEYIVRSLMW